MAGVHLIKRVLAQVGSLWGVLGIALGMLILGHWLIGGIAGIVLNAGAPDPRSFSPVYSDFPERVQYWREDAAVGPPLFEPYFHWRRGEFVGKFINLEPGGVRVTIKDPRPDATKVFMFGGSTMWGSGAPDKYTIPSQVQSLLGMNFDVYNFGERGYVSTQELNYLLYLLANDNIPDIVVFYDGVNDGYAGVYSPAVPRDPQVLRDRYRKEEQARARGAILQMAIELYESSNYPQLLGYLRGRQNQGNSDEIWDQAVAGAIERNSREVVRMYEAHIAQVRALAKAYGFTPYFFWQPNLYSLTRSANEFEKQVIDESSATLIRSQQAVYQEAKAQFSAREQEGIYFLGNIFDQVPAPIYADWNHLGANGNRIVANVMAPVIRDTELVKPIRATVVP